MTSPQTTLDKNLMIDRSNYYVVFLARKRKSPLGYLQYATREAAIEGLETARVELTESWLARASDEEAFA